MTTAAVQPDRSAGAIEKAVDLVVDTLGLKPATRKALLEFVSELVEEFPKLPHVTFYTAKTRHGGINCRITYRVKGYKLRTERIGKVRRLAYKRAQRVSEILQQVEARLLPAKDAHRLLYVDSTPIDKHRKSFIASLRAKGNHPDYVSSQEVRLGRVFELAGYQRVSDITRESLTPLIEALTGYIEPGNKRTLTKSTINYYLKVLRQFTRWATPVLIPADPLYNTTGVKNTDQVKRRDVLPEEVAAVVVFARSGRIKRMRMAGADRAIIYLTAFGTGFRRNELRQLDVPLVKLEMEPPRILLPAAIAKNRHAEHQPLPLWLAAELKKWLGGRKTGKLFTYLPLAVASMFERDREATRKAWIDEAADPAEREKREQSDFLKRDTVDGELVFHSHRHGFASQLLDSGLDLKTAQMLTRHSTVAMLADRYAHSRLARAAQGVESAIKDPTVKESVSDGAQRTAQRI